MRSASEGGVGTHSLIGKSRAVREVIQLVDTVAQSDCSVLIEGESGTGKELAARRLHAMSPRRDRPFIPVNCAGLTEGLFESQFFGHLRGAFTGASQTMLGMVRTANQGTLFVDEIGDIPLSLQAKLLRVLQEGEVTPVGQAEPVEVNTRFLTATNRNLRHEVQEGRFREDLFYRLNVVRIYMPPLREHAEDVDVLLDSFLARYAVRYHRPAVQVGRDVRSKLMSYRWPGNVRELVNWVERLYATGASPDVLATSLLLESGEPEMAPRSELMSLQQAERWAILRAVESTESYQEAAEVLQIHRSTLSRKLKEYGLM